MRLKVGIWQHFILVFTMNNLKYPQSRSNTRVALLLVSPIGGFSQQYYGMCFPPIACVARYVPHCKSLFHCKFHIYPATYFIKSKSPCISLKIPICCISLSNCIPLQISVLLHIAANLYPTACHCKSLSRCISQQIPIPLHVTANPYHKV